MDWKHVGNFNIRAVILIRVIDWFLQTSKIYLVLQSFSYADREVGRAVDIQTPMSVILPLFNLKVFFNLLQYRINLFDCFLRWNGLPVSHFDSQMKPDWDFTFSFYL